MLFFNHPKPPCRKAVAVQMVAQQASLVPDLGVIVVETKKMQPELLQEVRVKLEAA
jgi:hypothetical protein